MKPYVRSTPSFRTDVNWSGSPTVIVTSQAAGTGNYESLSSVSSTAGDYVRANPQEYVHEWYRHVHGSQSTVSNNGKTGQTREGLLRTVDLPVDLDYGFSTVAYNSALSKAYAAIRGDLDLSIDGFQRKQTIGMVSSILGFAKSLKTVNGAIRAVQSIYKSNPRDWGNLWLGYTYGLKPTMNSIYETFDKVFTEPNLSFQQVSVKGKEKRIVSYTATSVYGAPFRDTFWYEVSDRVLFGFDIALENTVLTQLAGFTSLNPLSIAYELMPYSFVADWFLNVGGYLRSLESALLYHTNMVDGFVTKTKRVQGFTLYQGYSNNGLSTSTLNAQGAFKHTHKVRSSLATLPFPYPPKIDMRLGTSRLISAASLLGQHLSFLEHADTLEERTLRKLRGGLLPDREVKIPTFRGRL